MKPQYFSVIVASLIFGALCLNAQTPDLTSSTQAPVKSPIEYRRAVYIFGDYFQQQTDTFFGSPMKFDGHLTGYTIGYAGLFYGGSTNFEYSYRSGDLDSGTSLGKNSRFILNESEWTIKCITKVKHHAGGLLYGQTKGDLTSTGLTTQYSYYYGARTYSYTKNTKGDQNFLAIEYSYYYPFALAKYLNLTPKITGDLGLKHASNKDPLYGDTSAKEQDEGVYDGYYQVDAVLQLYSNLGVHHTISVEGGGRWLKFFDQKSGTGRHGLYFRAGYKFSF